MAPNNAIRKAPDAFTESLTDTSDVAALIRNMDWSQTALGAR